MLETDRFNAVLDGLAIVQDATGTSTRPVLVLRVTGLVGEDVADLPGVTVLDDGTVLLDPAAAILEQPGPGAEAQPV